jgi:hypothetical protein
MSRIANGETGASGGGYVEIKGEHRLLANVLHRALEDASSDKVPHDIQTSALAWINCDTYTREEIPKGFDFNSVCDFLRLDPGWVRKIVKEKKFKLSSHNSIREVQSRRKGPEKGFFNY